LLRGEKTSFVYLDKRILSVIGLWHLQASELGRLLIGVSEDRQIEISGLKLEAARLLTPPIHPRVSSAVAVPSALLLISRAGRDGVARFA
jgi:hypothetical protein